MLALCLPLKNNKKHEQWDTGDRMEPRELLSNKLLQLVRLKTGASRQNYCKPVRVCARDVYFLWQPCCVLSACSWLDRGLPGVPIWVNMLLLRTSACIYACVCIYVRMLFLRNDSCFCWWIFFHPSFLICHSCCLYCTLPCVTYQVKINLRRIHIHFLKSLQSPFWILP